MTYTIGLAQINNSFSGQNYLPYSVALLQAYAEQFTPNPERYRFLLPLYKRLRISDAVDQLKDVDIAAFSTYVWNTRISLEIARRLKTVNPNVLVIFGGPQVPDQPEGFLRQHPFIDVVVHNEGERTFLHLLEAFPSNDWTETAGISYLDRNENFVRYPNSPRIRDLDEVPSPFLEGKFDALIQANPQENWIGLWETNRGCPFQCTFCDWGSATAAKVTRFGMQRLMAEVDWFSRHRLEYIFCCDANFGSQKRDVEIVEHVAEMKRKTGFPRALSVQNTKNATERAYLTQKILADAGLNKGVALSMQSLDLETLKAIKRDNISLDTYLELQRRFTRDRVETYSDLILGLPGETYGSFVNGVDQLMESGQHNRIQFNNLSILPNTEMGNPEYQRRYGMVTVESEIINIHGERVEIDDDVPETQQLVVATTSMSAEDWRRVRAYSWMTALLHFDKLLQIPLIVARATAGVRYVDMISAFMEADPARTPLLAEIRDFFLREAKNIQNGGPEYVYSPEWLGIHWPADEYIFIKLTAESRLDAFYSEAGTLLTAMVREHDPSAPLEAFQDALTLNRRLLKQPFVQDNVVVHTRYDIMSFYHGVLNGEEVPLRRVPVVVEIDRTSEARNDFQTWCREVVWWGNKKGAYLYGNRVLDWQLAGHY